MTDLFGQIDDITCWHVSQVSKWAIINGTMCEDILSWVKLWYHVCRYSIMSVVMVPCVQIFNHAWKNVNNMASMVWISFFSFFFLANRVWRRLDMPISFNMSHYMWIYLKKCQKYSQNTEPMWVWIDKVGWSRFFFAERNFGKLGMAEVISNHQLQNEPSYVKLSQKITKLLTLPLLAPCAHLWPWNVIDVKTH
jgi:hypothetical protein